MQFIQEWFRTLTRLVPLLTAWSQQRRPGNGQQLRIFYITNGVTSTKLLPHPDPLREGCLQLLRVLINKVHFHDLCFVWPALKYIFYHVNMG